MIQRVLCAVVLLGVMTACAHVPRMSDYSHGGTLLDDTERATTLKSFREQTDAIRSLKLFSRCTLSHGNERFGLRYAFVASSTGEMRVEQFPTTGFYALTTLVSGEKGTTVVFQNEQKAILTPPGALALSALFGFELPLDTRSAGALLGGALSPEHIDSVREVRRDAGAALVAYAPHFIASYGENKALEQYHLFDVDSGKELLSISYTRDGNVVPSRFTLSFPREEATLDCSALKRAVNEPLQPNIFTIDVPSGFSVDDQRF